MKRCPECGGLLVTKDIVYNPEHEETYRKRGCIQCGYTMFTVEFEVENNKQFQHEWDVNNTPKTEIFDI